MYKKNMENETKKDECCGRGCHSKKNNKNACGACGGGIYGLAFIGAVIYFVQNADSFWAGVLGVGKAIVWPAILVYKLLEFLMK